MDSLEGRFQALSISRRLQPEEPWYILDLSLSPADVVAASCSSRAVRLHAKETLRVVGECRGHAGAVFGVRFSPSSPHLLFSGSSDGTLRCWDARRPGSCAVQVFRSGPDHAYCAFDVSANGALVCAGAERVADDSFLVFWDSRMTEGGAGKARLLGVYSESHSDDITAVRFHPKQADRLASGSTDGLVNVFDLSLGAEDDALVATCNCESSASALCWSGENQERLLCLTHDEGVRLWDLSRLDTDDSFALFGSSDARTLVSLPEGTSLDYFVSGLWLEDAARLLVVGGSHSGELHLLDCSGAELKPIRSLSGGHSSTVRCVQWDAVGGALLTGGEDGQLLQWRAGAEEIGVGSKGGFKSVSSARLKAKSRRAGRRGEKRTL